MSLDGPPIRRWLRWMFEGRYRWGYSTSSTGRYGSRSLYLHVYPPDTPRILRRCAHLSRIWIPVSTVGTVATAPLVATIVEMSLLTASAGPAALLLLAWIALQRVAAPLNKQLMTTSAHKSTINPNLDDELRFDQVHIVLDRLRQAERQMDAGEISHHEYRARWSSAFAEL